MTSSFGQLLVATVLGITAVAAAGGAQEEPSVQQSDEGAVLDDAEALAIDAKLYAAEFGVPFDEAVERLTIMIYGMDAVSQAAAEGNDLAGRYFDNEAPEFGLVVATKKAQAAPRTVSFTPRTRVMPRRTAVAPR
jgi:hypothetical protein